MVNRVRGIVPFVDLLTRQQVPGIEIRACERRDADCQMPVASAGGNENGEADLRLPGGFNGYLRLQSPNIYPTMFFFGLPIVTDSIVPVEVVSPETFEGLNTPFSEFAIEGRAAVLVYVKNCGGAPGAGVTLSVAEADSATRAFYLVDTLLRARPRPREPAWHASSTCHRATSRSSARSRTAGRSAGRRCSPNRVS